MQVSVETSLDDKRAHFTIGRVSAPSPWRPSDVRLDEHDRAVALRALQREAEEYGADGVVEVAYAEEECRNGECEGVKLHRLVATGRAVRLSQAA